jgi:hypothetical protein
MGIEEIETETVNDLTAQESLIMFKYSDLISPFSASPIVPRSSPSSFQTL